MIHILLLLAALAPAQQSGQVKRGSLDVRVKVTGTVVPTDLFRLKATIDGRVEAVLFSTSSWAEPKDNLGFLASKELTAIVDARGSTQRDILEERWQRIYKPTPIRCPERCFLLKSFIKTKQWVKPRAILVEAAKTLRLVGRVRPEDAHWIKDGMEFTFWAVADPMKTHKARVAHYVLDVQGERVEPGGTFTLDMDPGRWFPPGTEWEGQIIPLSKKNVLVAPTGALLRYNGEVYIPVKVSTGITTNALTEITSGIEDGRKVLILDDARLREAQRHVQEIDVEALNQRIKDANAAQPQEPAEKALTTPPAEVPKRERERKADLPDPDSNLGEDPYAE